ncbi:MAG TPA: amidohydrolase family protein, partial [Ferruginibacter sp.]|nr:amidohydrolase family protein [Ferruginibacter sp.]
LSTNPAKIFGMFPRKGCIAPGSDADIVLFDPNKEHTISVDTHHMNTDYSAYEGWKLTGKCKTVILRGNVVIDEGECLAEKGYGKYIRRNKVSQLI